MAEKNTSTLLFFNKLCTVRMAQWYEDCFLRRRKLGCRFKSRRGYLQFFFFHRIFTLRLVSVYSVSLLTLF